jgi:hypothetical protein
MICGLLATLKRRFPVKTPEEIYDKPNFSPPFPPAASSFHYIS